MIKLYTPDEAETRRKVARLARLLNIPQRRHRVTGKMTANLSATIDRALDIATAAELARREAAQEQAK